MSSNMRTILVTGGAGYVGSKLVSHLLDNNFKVKVYDTFWYGDQVFGDLRNCENIELIHGDIRDLEKLNIAVAGCTDLIHLACISNDPSYELDPKLGQEINFDCFLPLVNFAQNNGIQRFIYASSSSVYGVKEEEKVTEKLSLEPLTDYSKFKAKCEPILLEKSSNNFITTVVRPATICGYSPRQRLDLSVNILTNHAYNEKRIKVFGGQQYRPNLHIDDMCDAYISILNQPPNLVNGEIFNVGAENMKIIEIANLVNKVVDYSAEISFDKTNDTRSYRVSSDYIHEKIGFLPKKSVLDAIQDLIEAFKLGRLPNSLTDAKYFNLKRMNQILN